MEKGLIFLKLIHYKGQDMLSTALNDVHNQHRKEKCHHLLSWKWPRQDEQLHIYFNFNHSLTSFKDVNFPWLFPGLEESIFLWIFLTCGSLAQHYRAENETLILLEIALGWP